MTDATDITLNAPTPDDGRPEDDQVQIAQTDAGEQTEVEGATGNAASQAETMVNRPAAGQTVEVPVQPGERYVIDFDPTEAQVVIDGDDFILLFADGGRIVFPNLVPMAESANSPVLEVGGVDIGGDVIIAQARALSGEQPTLETAAGDTAAGPDAQGSGANEYNDNLGDIIDTLDAQPPLIYVEREFGLIDVEVIDPLLLDEEPTIPSLNVLPSFGTVSEAFKPQQSPPGTGLNPGDNPEFSDDPGEPRVAFEGTADLGSNEGGVITGLVLEDGTVATPSPVGASFTTDFDNVTQQLTLTTVNEGDFLVPTPLGNILYVNVLTGEWQYILLASETHPGVGLSGPDDVLQEVFTYTVTDGFGQTVSSTITVTIEDDAPIANNEDPLSVFEDGFVSASGSVLGNDQTGADGTETTLDDPSTPDDDEIQTVASAGTSAGSQQEVPAGEDGLTIVGSFGTLTIRQDGTYDYSANPDTGGMTDTFVYTIRDADGDEAQATITIDIKDGPGGDLIVADSAPQGFIPEDTKTPVTLRAVTGDPDDDDQILTQVILDLPFQVDTTGTVGDQWQLDLGQLETLFGVAEGAANPTGLVTSWTFDEATGVLVINLNPDPSVTDDSLSSAPLDRNSFEVTFDLTPPDDSDVDIEGAEVTASALDTVSGATGSGTGTSDITVDAIVDGSEVLIDADGDPATAPVVITDTNDDIGTNVDTPVNLGLSLVLGNDSTDLSNDDAPVQGGTDGSDDADETERVTEVTVQLDQGATLDLTGLDPQPTVSDLGGGVTLYTFDTSDLPVAGAVGTPNADAVSGLIDDFVVIPATGVTKDISVVITTTTEEAASSTTNPNGASGQEINDPDNIDIDTYNLTVKVVDIPGGKLEANGDPNGFIPEDVPTNVVLTAAVGDPTDPNEVLTQIVVDFGTPIDLDRSSLDTQWQLEASDLDTIRGLPGVTAVELADGGTVLTITLDPTAGIQTFSADLTLTTPDDSDVDLDGVQVTVTAEDTSVGVTATGTSTSDITVDAIVDGSEVFRNGKVIDPVNDNDDLGTTTNTPVNLGLSLALGFDSTDLANGDAPTQGDTDGSDAGDLTEEVIQVTLQLDQGATVDLSLLSPQPTVEDLGGGVTLYTFDTAGLGEAAVNTLVSKFVVTPAAGATGDITVVVETTTRELNTPPDSVEAPSGDEANIADNTDIDTYRLTLKVVDVPGGDLKVTGNPDGVIPEDVPTETTLSASVGDPSDPNEVLTQIVVDFKTAIDLDGSNTADQWQLDPADLDALRALPGVTSVVFVDGGTTLTVNLDPAANIQTFSEILTLTTPDDSDVDLDGVEVTVTAVDTSVGTDASGTSTSDIVADAVVDGSEVLRNSAIINSSNNSVGTNVNAAVLLGLTLDLGLDNTNAGNSADPSQSDVVDGSDAADATETVTLVTVLVDQGATLTFAGATATTSSTAPGETLYSFDTSGLNEGQVSALLASFQVTPATGATEDINVTVTTTTRELNTPPASTNAPSGDEVVIADNTDVDSYQLVVKVVGVPGGELTVTGNPDGVVPEDVPTETTLSASVGDPSDPNEVLTQIVVDFKTAIDLDGSNTADQWQLDPADLDALRALPGVTSVVFADGGTTLTVNLDPAAGIQTFNGLITLTTPDDSDVDLDGVEVTVTARDTSVGTDASGTSTSDIVADAVIDGSEITFGTPTGLQNQFGPIDLTTELVLGSDSTNAGNSTDPSQSDVTDGTIFADDTEFVSKIEVTLTDQTSGDPTGTLNFLDPLPAGITVTSDPVNNPGVWTFEISDSASSTNVQALVDSFGVTPDFNYSGTINAQIETTMEELNTPAGANPPSGDEVNVADNVDVDTYNVQVEVEPVQVNKAVEVSGGEPKPFNIVFVIDRSGSMGDPVEGGGPSRFSVAEDAFRTLISDIRDQGIEVANVRLLGFNTGTLDVTDFTGLPTDDQVDDFFDDLGSPNGGTRYEPPLTSASNFLNDINTDNPDVEYDNRILFLSDGGNNNSDGGFLLGTANGNNNAGSFDELSRLYSNVGEVGDDIPNLTIKSVGFGIDKSFDPFAQDNLGSGASDNVNAYLALDQSDDNMVNGSAVVSNANNGADLAAAFGNIVDPALAEGTLFEGHTFVGTGQLNSFSHFGRIYDASIAVDNANRDAAVAGDVVANTGSAVTIKTENSGFLTIWFADEGGRLEGDFRYEGPPNFPGDRTDTVNYIVQDDVGLQLGQLDINISGQAPANGDFENGNLVDWEFLGSVYLEDNADLSSSNPAGDDFVAVLATNNANGLDPRDGGGNANREDEGVVDDTTLEDGNLTPVEDLGKDNNLQNLQLYTEADLETTLAANGDGTNNVDLSGLVADDILDGAVIQTSFQLDPLFGTPTGNQNLEISFDWNFATDEGAGGQNDIAFAVIEGQLFLLGSLGSSTFDGGAIDVGESEITYDRSTGWETATFSLGSDFQDVDGDNVIHIAFGVADAGSNVGENSALLLDNVRADVS